MRVWATCLPLLVAGLVVALVGTWPAGCSGTQALGSPTGEAPVHLWSLWTTTAGFWEHGPLLRAAEVGFPDVFRQHLMDPANLVFFGPLYALGGGGEAAAIRAWNGLYLGGIVLAAWGAVALARRLRPGTSPWATTVLLVAVAGSAAILDFPSHGRSELWPAVLLPWLLALLHDATWGERPVRSALLAGLLLGLTALGGWYLATFLLVGVVPIALLWAARTGPRHALRMLLCVGGVAILCVLPALWALYAWPPDALIDASDEIPSLVHGTSDVVFGIEAHIRQPAIALSRPLESPAYPGIVCLLLGMVGLVLRPRATLPWLAWGVWIVLLAAGPFLVFGQDISARNLDSLRLPAFFLETWFPALRPISSWSRLGCLVAVPFGVAAWIGADAALGRLGKLAPIGAIGICIGMLADHLTYPNDQRGLERSFTLATPPDLLPLVEQLPEGALILVPLDLHLGAEAQVHGRRLLWQQLHDRPVTASPPEQDTLVGHSYVGRLLALSQEKAAGRRGPNTVRMPPFSGRRTTCMRRDLSRLATEGHAAVGRVIADDPDETVRKLLRPPLGEPDHVTPTLEAWVLDPELGDGGSPCALPPLASTLRPVMDAP